MRRRRRPSLLALTPSVDSKLSCRSSSVATKRSQSRAAKTAEPSKPRLRSGSGVPVLAPGQRRSSDPSVSSQVGGLHGRSALLHGGLGRSHHRHHGAGPGKGCRLGSAPPSGGGRRADGLLQTISFSEETKHDVNLDLLDEVAWCQIQRLTVKTPRRPHPPPPQRPDPNPRARGSAEPDGVPVEEEPQPAVRSRPGWGSFYLSS